MFQLSVFLGWLMVDFEVLFQVEQVCVWDLCVVFGVFWQCFVVQEWVVELGVGFVLFELGKMVGVVDQGEFGVFVGMGEYCMFLGLGEMVVFVGEYQGWVGWVLFEVVEGQQVLVILLVVFDFCCGQVL